MVRKKDLGTKAKNRLFVFVELTLLFYRKTGKKQAILGGFNG